ncbi:hypothetical protein LP416_29005 [Polaromonas sp. P2-4]|nr:hypothetical protein LP416_29005 [Polaromonas sp. P2-4]
MNYDDLIKPEFQSIYAPTHQAISYALDLTIDNTLRLLRLNSGPGTLFRYNFNWRDTPAPWKDTFGAFHGIDIALLFGNYVTEPNFMHFAWDANNAVAPKAVGQVHQTCVNLRPHRQAQPAFRRPNHLERLVELHRWFCQAYGLRQHLVHVTRRLLLLLESLPSPDAAAERLCLEGDRFQ